MSNFKVMCWREAEMSRKESMISNHVITDGIISISDADDEPERVLKTDCCNFMTIMLIKVLIIGQSAPYLSLVLT